MNESITGSIPERMPGATETIVPDPARPLADFAVPGFAEVARMVAAAVHASRVVLTLLDGSAYWFVPPSENAERDALQPLLQETAHLLEGRVVEDIRALGIAPERSTTTRFLASEPVATLTGTHVGALCVLSEHPRRDLEPDEARALRDGASLLGHGLVLRSYLGRADPVTQLPDRGAFFQDLRERLEGGAGSVHLAAIEMAPVGRFNDFIRAMGHRYSDSLMRQAAARLRSWLQEGETLYHVGPSRFAMMFGSERPPDDVRALDHLLAMLRETFDCESIPLSLQPGVGLLAVNLEDVRTGDPLRRVMSASHMALENPRGWCRYSADEDDRQRQEFFLVTELSGALSEHTEELELHFQPRIDLDTGRCVAVEALTRWRHPTLGYIPPGQFVPLAERAALMRTLTDWVFETGCAQLARWRAAGRSIGLSFNVSSNDVVSSLIQRLEDITRRHGIGMDGLELEFTETSLLQQSAHTHDRLRQLRDRGIGVAIDDFGTGYSNLSYLRRMPASTLKIDQSFVRAVMESPEDATIVSSIAHMARKLGFRVVVEGVETAAIFNAVRDMDCDEVQGYYIARPMPAAALDAWLDAHDAAPLPPRR